jgi:hypothetical protein
VCDCTGPCGRSRLIQATATTAPLTGSPAPLATRPVTVTIGDEHFANDPEAGSKKVRANNAARTGV